MKNNILKTTLIIGIIALAYYSNNDIGFCAAQAVQQVQPAAQSTSPISLQGTIIKFLYAMGAVVLSSVILFAGLSLYNKFFVKAKYKQSPEDEILKTPKTVDEAVNFFIKKNKIS